MQPTATAPPLTQERNDLQYIKKFYDECNKKADDGNLLKSLQFLVETTNDAFQQIILRMDIQLSYIYRYDEKWIEQKIKDFFSGESLIAENFNGLLGEIRAYGELLELKASSLDLTEIKTPMDGSDFIAILNDQNIHVEVNTPQKSGKVTSRGLETKKTEGEKHTIKMEIGENAPYGFPVRDIDNVQYEAVSKFAQIKQNKEKKQFKENDISILWLDINDPTIFMFNQIEYTTPILSFNGLITSGFMWNAFYSKRGDNIYSNYSYLDKDVIKMEFDGRFNSDSNIDFVIIDCFTHKVIFENQNSTKDIPTALYKLFFNLHNLNNQYSYLSFMKKDELKQIIESERNISNNILNLI